MQPFKLANNTEAKWAKEWLSKQISTGTFPGLRPDAILHLYNADDTRRFIDRNVTHVEDRRRLQKALSTRRASNRSKEKGKQRNVTTELERDARQILLDVAQHRGITTSELIRSTFEDEYDKINN